MGDVTPLRKKKTGRGRPQPKFVNNPWDFEPGVDEVNLDAIYPEWRDSKGHWEQIGMRIPDGHKGYYAQIVEAFPQFSSVQALIRTGAVVMVQHYLGKMAEAEASDDNTYTQARSAGHELILDAVLDQERAILDARQRSYDNAKEIVAIHIRNGAWSALRQFNARLGEMVKSFRDMNVDESHVKRFEELRGEIRDTVAKEAPKRKKTRRP